MATTLFKLQIENFYRGIGEGDVGVTLGTPSTLTKPSGGAAYTPVRWTLPKVYDYFWRSGLILLRVIRHSFFDRIDELIPMFVESETVSLTAGIGNVSDPIKYDYIFRDAFVKYEVSTGVFVWYLARRSISTLDYETIKSTGQRRSPSVEAPVFTITKSGANQAITVYPIASSIPQFKEITFKFIRALERLEATSTGDDIWPRSLSDILIDGALMIAKGDANDLSVEEYFSRKLAMKIQLFDKPSVRQNTSTIEENK